LILLVKKNANIKEANMKYFVSIENNVYSHWQIELLIESFKLHGIENDLMIAVAENENPCPDWFVKNITAHQNKFKHHNYGNQRKHRRLNKLYALYAATKSKLIEPPFVLLHPDMILLNPIKTSESCNILYDKNDSNDFFIETIKNKVNGPWMDIGCSITFLDCPVSLFERAFIHMDDLVSKNVISRNIEKIAWNFAIYDQKIFTAKQTYKEISLLNADLNGDIIHYRHGLPPVFTKKNYLYAEPSYFSASEHPYKILLKHDVSPVMGYVKKVVKSYNDNF